MDPFTVGIKCFAKGFIKNTDLQKINTDVLDAKPVEETNEFLIEKLKEKGIKGYNVFKEALQNVKDGTHRELLRKIKEAEDKIWTGAQ